MSERTAPPDFRLRQWTFEGQEYVGLICDVCGFCADPEDPASADQAALDRAADRHDCPTPTDDWDLWRRHAWEQGVDPELADLGRAVYRECLQHGWGLRIDDEAMIRRALHEPEETRAWWERLLQEEL